MNFKWNEEQLMLKNTARKFLENECPKAIAKEMMTDKSGYLPEMWRKMADLGWLGLTFEEQYGGSGGSYLDLIVLLEEMGRSMVPGPYFSSVVLGGMILAEGGSKDLKEKYLPSLCKGAAFLTLAITEDEGFWSSRSIRTYAERRDGLYFISGRKMFVPDAHLANAIFTVTRTGEVGEAITTLVVDPGSRGVTLNPLQTIAGDKQFEVLFEKVQVSGDQRIGQEGQGWAIIDKAWPKIIMARCAEMLGGMEQVLEMTVQYAKERRQFGVPIGGFQVVQHYCVDMLIQLEMVRFMVYQAAWRASGDLPCAKEASISKAFCSEAFNKITAIAHQIHGGLGFTYEHDLHIYFRHAKAWELMMGDAIEHRRIVAREMGF
jgi:alkylation response protein AidB-like acyl-CoA dehydrogenase